MSNSYNPNIEQRNRAVIRVNFITLSLNLCIAALKIVIGLLSSSMTVLADGFHAVVDAINNVLGIVALSIAAKPADEDHPYGHQKFENLAAMLIGGFIVLVGWQFAREVISRVTSYWRGGADSQTGPHFEWTYLAVLVLTLCANIAISTYEYRIGKKLQSTFLVADSLHTRSDILVTLLGTASLILGHFYWWLDIMLAMVVVGFIFYAGWSILRENMDVFTDRVRLDPLEVRNVVDKVPGVLNTHAIRSHGTATSVHLDLHIVIPDTASAKEAEAIEEAVRDALLERFPNISFVSIHHQTHSHDDSVPLWSDKPAAKNPASQPANG